MSVVEEQPPVGLVTYLDSEEPEQEFVLDGESYNCYLPERPGDSLWGYAEARYFCNLIATRGLVRYLHTAEAAHNMLPDVSQFVPHEIRQTEHNSFMFDVYNPATGEARPARFTFVDLAIGE